VAGRAKTQARQIVDVIAVGGVAIIPLDVAYGIIGNSRPAIETIFRVKKRSFEKPSGFFANWDLFTDIQITTPCDRDVVKAITLDNDLPFSTVAPFRADHPMIRALDPFVLEHTTKDNSLDMLMNAGPVHNAMTRICFDEGIPVVGSSANISLAGSKYRLADIEPEVRAAADIAFDGGLSRYHNDEGLSSTIVDIRSYRTVRRGVCYEKICAILLKDFGIDLIANGPA